MKSEWSKQEFFLQKVYLGWDIPAFLLDQEGRILCSACPPQERGADAGVVHGIDRETILAVRSAWRGRGTPVLWFATSRIVYMGFEDEGERLYLLGPAALGYLSAEQQHRYWRQQRRRPQAEIPVLTLQQAACALSMLYAAMSGTMISEEWILKQSVGLEQNMRGAGGDSSSRAFFDGTDPEQEPESDFAGGRTSSQSGASEETTSLMDTALFYSHEEENHFLEEFKQGTMRIPEEVILRDMWQMECVSPLAQKDFLKQCEYSVISAIVITRRAAIEVGVPEEVCYRRSFVYMKRLSECRTPVQMMYVYADVINEWGERIQKRRSRQNAGEPQEQCKDYIARHIRRKFTVEEMAGELGYHPGYLSRLFSRKEGMTIQQYILRERLQLAANLLVNSNVRIREISDYLAFHSQSYLTEQFVKQYRMTPSEYRRRNKMR
ncbi:MAG: AraC family transcriptional regulator [Eubacteriales bacterium]|nr:AraC family transcriptional regulator [Eubacteriales bacterium]